MAHPIPNAHVVAEPWFQSLRGLKRDPNTKLRTLAAPVRTLAHACADVLHERAAYSIRMRQSTTPAKD